MEEIENIWISAKVGVNIRNARNEKGLSQLDLAERVNASQPQIAAYEQGEKDIPLSRLFEIAELLGVTVADLFSGDQ